MNEKEKRKRRHDSESDGMSSEGEPKSRKIARKSSRTQLDEKKRDEKKSKHEQPNTRESRSTSGNDSSDSSRHKKKSKKRKYADRKNKQRRKKEKRKKRRERKEKMRKRTKGSDEEKADVKRAEKDTNSKNTDGTLGDKSISPPSNDLGAVAVPKKRPMVPMTKEEFEKQQAQVRRVYDPETGRHRLIKGTGEVLEEIVSRERHKAINKTATQGDGAFFQANLGLGDK